MNVFDADYEKMATDVGVPDVVHAVVRDASVSVQSDSSQPRRQRGAYFVSGYETFVRSNELGASESRHSEARTSDQAFADDAVWRIPDHGLDSFREEVLPRTEKDAVGAVSDRLVSSRSVAQLDLQAARQIADLFSPSSDDPRDFALHALRAQRDAGMLLRELLQVGPELYKAFTNRCYYLKKNPRKEFETLAAHSRSNSGGPVSSATGIFKPRKSDIGVTISAEDYRLQLRAYNRDRQAELRSRGRTSEQK